MVVSMIFSSALHEDEAKMFNMDVASPVKANFGRISSFIVTYEVSELEEEPNDSLTECRKD